MGKGGNAFAKGVHKFWEGERGWNGSDDNYYLTSAILQWKHLGYPLNLYISGMF